MKHYTGTNYSQVVNILLALSGKRKLVATSIDGKADERTDAAIHKMTAKIQEVDDKHITEEATSL